MDEWLSDDELSVLARLVRRQQAASGREAVRVERVELFVGTDAGGRRFLTGNPVADWTPPEPRGVDPRRWRGSLLAGACGDALGAPIESKSMERVRAMTGPDGILDFIPAYNGIGMITDDTQMTLFTLEALIRAHAEQRHTGETDLRYGLQLAYQRWLHTQGVPWDKARGPRDLSERPDGWLITNEPLHHRRAPGQTCFFALKGYGSGVPMGTVERPLNESKGCGGVMRAAPAAIWSDDPAEAFEIGVMSAALTHSHPSGYLPAGTFAAMVHQLVRGASLGAALASARELLVGWNGHEETSAAIDAAIALAERGEPTPEKTATLGGGGVGETALSIALYAALVTDNPNDALLVSVNHGGDSDSTASVCGNLVGAMYGPEQLRPNWLDQLELRDVIEQIADDALAEFGPEPPEWGQKYPPSIPAREAPETGPAEPQEHRARTSLLAALETETPPPPALTRAERFRGSILAGAVGDALGAAREFDPMERIRQLHGPAGITDLVPAFGGLGKITDDTQMTLFTLEGLIRGHAHLRRGGQTGLEHFVQSAYQRWLHTQDYAWEDCRGPHDPSPEPDGWLISHRELFSRRAPGKTCLTALMSYGNNGRMGSFTHQLNTSKGCGGVMRTAPAALWPGDPAAVFGVGAMAAALSHSHPTGYLSAGALSVIVRHLIDGGSLPSAVEEAFRQLARRPQHEETTAALRFAVRLAEQGPPTPEKIATIDGGGWIGESALAIAVYVALTTDNLDDALLAAVNHSGDSDSTGAICGNIAGALYGPNAIRASWLERLELRGAIEELVADALAEFGPEPPTHSLWERKYPNS
ncbi:ADP-ribosylglycohydrolase family protein [Amycolatopsis sp. YIM 10]|uniref:ADP-ribosylglycohydrolase family protein n=1 Tax=Amycolatopsis sp. YIM 10 TaxID=2653857 RepID=UPI0012A8BCD5|nr:ADP-ribosylglycohydrolase family protein [Amycolatopsis sp. YIM 10]QFU94756.1 ADP-ribosyl-[dinitrogen reductase] glycohydrolase [Amycolatopsis sp. YIM 10]